MDILDYIVEKYKLEITDKRMPIEIPGVGRDDLAALFSELGFVVGVEMGVERAAYSKVLCESNPGLMLWGVDSWTAYKGYRDHVSQAKLDRFFEEAKEIMAPYNWRPIRKFSVDAARDFDDNSIDFVYIDGNHALHHVIADITHWEKKVRKGGIVSGHDFRKSKHNYLAHVVQAVQAYTSAWRIRPWFVLGRRSAPKGEKREGARSWMWVRS